MDLPFASGNFQRQKFNFLKKFLTFEDPVKTLIQDEESTYLFW